MKIGKAFSFIFEDKEWPGKMIIGAVMVFMALTVVLAPFVLGYLLQVMGNAARGEKTVLPKWEKWGKLYKSGLKALLVIVIYMVVFGLLEKVLNNLPSPRTWHYFLNILGSFYLPIALLFLAVSGDFDEAFAFEKIFAFMWKNIVELLIIWVLGFVLIPVGISGVIVFIFGIFLTAFYSLLVRCYLYGEVYQLDVKRNRGRVVKK